MGHKEDLLAGAKQVLIERGYSNTTARDVVAASHTNLASIGYHYGSLDKCVAVFLNGEAIPAPNERGERVVDDSFLMCFNAFDHKMDFVIPADWYGEQWTAVLDTDNPTGETSVVVVAGETISLQARSLVVLRKTA